MKDWIEGYLTGVVTTLIPCVICLFYIIYQIL